MPGWRAGGPAPCTRTLQDRGAAGGSFCLEEFCVCVCSHGAVGCWKWGPREGWKGPLEFTQWMGE